MSAADLCLALALSALLSVVVAAAQYMRAEKAEAEVARLTADHLPRRIEPEDVRVGMVIEQRKGVCIMRGRVVAVEDGVFQCEVVWLRTENERNDWSLWLVEDAPAPVDPDAEALDQMAQAMANLDGSDDADEWVPWAEVALDALRETHDVTPRAEQ